MIKKLAIKIWRSSRVEHPAWRNFSILERFNSDYIAIRLEKRMRRAIRTKPGLLRYCYDYEYE